MSFIFTESMHWDCEGKGCPDCQGTGIVEGCEFFPFYVPHEPTEWARAFASVKKKHRVTFEKISKGTGITPSRLSEIRIGMVLPTIRERDYIEAYFKALEDQK